MEYKQYAETIEKVAPGVLRLAEPLGNRLLNCFLLEDRKQQILFDAGLPGSVTRRIAHGQINGSIAQLIISHADADHLGDTAALKSLFPKMRVVCHSIEKPRCEDHDRIVHERYDHAREQFGYGYDAEMLSTLRDACGDDFTIDDTLEENQTLHIESREWRVLHLPGHSKGHLALWNESERILLGGDVILGLGPIDIQGRPAMPGTHEDIPAYLKTIDRLEQLDVALALLGHWPPLDRQEFLKLLQQSRSHVERDVEALRTTIQQGGLWTFEELITILNNRFSSWSADSDSHYSYALSGYLRHLQECGELQITHQGLISA